MLLPVVSPALGVIHHRSLSRLYKVLLLGSSLALGSLSTLPGCTPGTLLSASFVKILLRQLSYPWWLTVLSPVTCFLPPLTFYQLWPLLPLAGVADPTGPSWNQNGTQSSPLPQELLSVAPVSAISLPPSPSLAVFFPLAVHL